MTIWFYSDPHFDHRSLVEGGTERHPVGARPDFKTVEEMNEALVERHNATVRPSDHVYCLGDFVMNKESLVKWASRLHGHKRIILGNHDLEKVELYLAAGFKKVMACRVLDDMLFTHFPIAPWSASRYRANVHGHCHVAKPLFYTAPNPDATGFLRAVRYINLSVEHTDYRPVSLETIAAWSRK